MLSTRMACVPLAAPSVLDGWDEVHARIIAMKATKATGATNRIPDVLIF